MTNENTFPEPDLETAKYLLTEYRELNIELLDALMEIRNLNKLGKTNEIADLCDKVISRNELEDF
jgi:hypothetical protein